MNKADLQRLKRDPRYRRIVAAHAALQARLQAADAAHRAETEAARKAFCEAAPELPGGGTGSLDEQIIAALRPRGDTVSVRVKNWLDVLVETRDVEVENVASTRATLVAFDQPFDLETGYQRGRRNFGSNSYRIVEDDLERIAKGQVKGWRQKPWETP